MNTMQCNAMHAIQYRWDPKTSTLELIGFHDPRVYVVSLSVIKNRFILVGDAYGSVQVRNYSVLSLEMLTHVRCLLNLVDPSLKVAHFEALPVCVAVRGGIFIFMMRCFSLYEFMASVCCFIKPATRAM